MIVLYHCLNLAENFKINQMVYLCGALYYATVILHNHCQHHYEKYFFFCKIEYLLFTPLGYPFQWVCLNYWCRKVQYLQIHKIIKDTLQKFQRGPVFWAFSCRPKEDSWRNHYSKSWLWSPSNPIHQIMFGIHSPLSLSYFSNSISAYTASYHDVSSSIFVNKKGCLFR